MDDSTGNGDGISGKKDGVDEVVDDEQEEENNQDDDDSNNDRGPSSDDSGEDDGDEDNGSSEDGEDGGDDWMIDTRGRSPRFNTEKGVVVRFVFTKVRGGIGDDGNFLQLCHIRFFDAARNEVNPRLEPDCVGKGMHTAVDEGPEKAFVDSLDSKFCDRTFLVNDSTTELEFILLDDAHDGNAKRNCLDRIRQYQFTLAGDCDHRDPVAWYIQYRIQKGPRVDYDYWKEAKEWRPLSYAEIEDPPVQRHATYPLFPFHESEAPVTMKFLRKHYDWLVEHCYIHNEAVKERALLSLLESSVESSIQYPLMKKIQSIMRLLKDIDSGELTMNDFYEDGFDEWGFGDRDVMALAAGIAKRSTKTLRRLKQIRLSSSSFGMLGIRSLLNVLSLEDCRIEKLDLSENMTLRDDGGVALAKGLASNTSVKEIDLTRTGVTDRTADAFLECLKSNRTLRRLLLPEGVVDGERRDRLKALLNQNQAVPFFKTAGGWLVQAGYAASSDRTGEEKFRRDVASKGWSIDILHKLRKSYKGLRCDDDTDDNSNGGDTDDNSNGGDSGPIVLDLSWCQYLGDWLGILEPILSSSSQFPIRGINFNYSKSFRDNSGVELAKILESNTTVSSVNVEGTSIGLDTIKAFTECTQKNTTLTIVQVDDEVVQQNEVEHTELRKILIRNKILSKHLNQLKTKGLGFYFQVVNGKLAWNRKNIFKHSQEADVSHALLLAIKMAFKEPGGLSREFDENDKSVSDLFIKNKGLALRELAETTLFEDTGENLIHWIASTPSQFALDLCKYLVEGKGADFDELTENDRRTAHELAVANKHRAFRQWAMSWGTVFERYAIEGKGGLRGNPIHESDNCTVHFAIDMKKKKSDNNRRVALKFMVHREQFDRELSRRIKQSDHYNSVEEKPGEFEIRESDNKFKGEHVVPLLRYYDFQKMNQEYLNDKDLFPYKKGGCLVMACGERNLHQIVEAENISADYFKILSIAKDIGEALQYLHEEHSLIHGDFKPRNLVRIDGDMKIIDFDASVEFSGEGTGELSDKYSSGYIAPEVARLRFMPKPENVKAEMEKLEKAIISLQRVRDLDGCWDRVLESRYQGLLQKKKWYLGEGEQCVLACRSGDIWSFGVVMYHLLIGRTLFSCDVGDNLDTKEERDRLVAWEKPSEDDLEKVLGKCKKGGVVTDEIREQARDVLKECLAVKDKRPHSMARVLKMEFFRPTQNAQNIKLLEQITVMLKRLQATVDDIPKLLMEIQTAKCPFLFWVVTEKVFEKQKKARNEAKEAVDKAAELVQHLETAERFLKPKEYMETIIATITGQETKTSYLQLLDGISMEPVISYKIESTTYPERMKDLAEWGGKICRVGLQLVSLANAVGDVSRCLGYPLPNIPKEHMEKVRGFLERIEDSDPLKSVVDKADLGFKSAELKVFSKLLNDLEKNGAVCHLHDSYNEEDLKDKTWGDALELGLTSSGGSFGRLQSITYVSTNREKRWGGTQTKPGSNAQTEILATQAVVVEDHHAAAAGSEPPASTRESGTEATCDQRCIMCRIM